MVEARGIEPLSKNKTTAASTYLAEVKISSKKAHFPKPKFRLRLNFASRLVKPQNYTTWITRRPF